MRCINQARNQVGAIIYGKSCQSIARAAADLCQSRVKPRTSHCHISIRPVPKHCQIWNWIFKGRGRGRGRGRGARRVPGLLVTTCLHPGGIPSKSASSHGWPAAQLVPTHVPAVPRQAAEEDRMQPQPAATAFMLTTATNFSSSAKCNFSLRRSVICSSGPVPAASAAVKCLHPKLY